MSGENNTSSLVPSTFKAGCGVLAGDLAHGERELEIMRAALAETDQILPVAEQGWKSAIAEELNAEIAECYQAVIEKHKSAPSAFDDVEKIVKEMLVISKRAREAHGDLVPLVRHDESQVARSRSTH